MSDELKPCSECGNTYLAIRTDIYKDARGFVYCDCCGCMADKAVWNRISPVSAPMGTNGEVIPLPPLPDFMRRDIVRAIEDAAHPKGMSVHDGKARIGGDRLQRLLLIADKSAERIRQLERELAELKGKS